MTGDPSDDLSDLIRELLRSIPPEGLADFGTFSDQFRPLRPTPVGKSKFKQSPEEIDRLLAEERKARATARTKPTHAEQGTRPGRKRKAAGQLNLAKAPLSGLDLMAAFSIAGAKARKHRQKLKRFGPAEPRGMHRRRPKKRVPTS